MAKTKSVFICTECGYQAMKWAGQCSDCGAWNTLNQEVITTLPKSSSSGGGYGAVSALTIEPLSKISADQSDRYKTGVAEFDRVLGGGVVPGSVVLLCGEPGIGKSTILLQVCHTLAKEQQVLYVSGEESPRQLKLRANRIGVDSENLLLSSGIDVMEILHAIETLRPGVVIIDSIQTLFMPQVSSSPGSVTQVRECTALLTQLAKRTGIPIFIVGHVNKDGGIAGPKVLEHMVDTVLYFEGDRNLSYRILRAIKNRYGSTNEIGVFQMENDGLAQVDNPSKMLLEGRPDHVSGTCVVGLIEGTRPILAEVQALVSKTGFGTPRRTSTGFDFNRTAMLIAVLEKRAGFFFGNLDAYINVVGGLRIDEPAADLAIALALVSNLLDKPLDSDVMVFGEIGLAGEVRAATQPQQRVHEAARMGFTKFIVPKQSAKQIKTDQFPNIEIIPVSNILQAIAFLKGKGQGKV